MSLFVVGNKLFNTIEEISPPQKPVFGAFVEVMSDVFHMLFIISNPFMYMIFDEKIRNEVMRQLFSRLRSKAPVTKISLSVPSVNPARTKNSTIVRYFWICYNEYIYIIMSCKYINLSYCKLCDMIQQLRGIFWKLYNEYS